MTLLLTSSAASVYSFVKRDIIISQSFFFWASIKNIQVKVISILENAMQMQGAISILYKSHLKVKQFIKKKSKWKQSNNIKKITLRTVERILAFQRCVLDLINANIFTFSMFK